MPDFNPGIQSRGKLLHLQTIVHFTMVYTRQLCVGYSIPVFTSKIFSLSGCPSCSSYSFLFCCRELLTEIELMLTTSILPPKCTLAIEETIPRGMYVDPDQLRDLHQTNGFASYIPTKVDVEKPEFESESFRVFIFRKLDIEQNLRVTNVQLPVHMRYHRPAQILDAKPSSSAPTAIVKFQNPRLLLSCEGENVASHCPEKAVTSFCDSTGTEKCEFLLIPYEIVSLLFYTFSLMSPF